MTDMGNSMQMIRVNLKTPAGSGRRALIARKAELDAEIAARSVPAIEEGED